MKSAIIALCIVACAYAGTEQEAQVISNNYEQTPEGNFNYGYETQNGISGQAQGTFKVVGKDEGAVVFAGSNSYTAPNGEPIQLTYVADENGYQPQGAHLPTPPAPEPIPEYIARSLAYIAAHPYVEPPKRA